jgi:ADP-heptose:LPS heptosyltransferase
MEFAIETGMQRDAELLYCDERRLNPTTGTLETYLKPQWSPDLLESTNYIGRLWCARADLLRRVGATTADLFRHGAYDLVLRCTEIAKAVGRIPKVLCDRPTGSPDAAASETAALARALIRRGVRGEVLPGTFPGTYRVHRQLVGRPLVSIIVVTRVAGDVVKTYLKRLRERTAYRNFEIVCAAGTPLGHDIGRGGLHDHADQVLTNSSPFNAAASNNRAAAAARGELLLFLDASTEITDPGWLEVLMVEAQRPEIGAAGGLIVDPEGRVQHAGIFLTAGQARCALRGVPAETAGYFGMAQMRRNVIAVTGACLITRRETFSSLGGFDVAPSAPDIGLDYCLRVHERGMFSVICPQARVIQHAHEIPGQPEPDETADFEARWHSVLARGDPYFHPGFLRSGVSYVPDPEPIRTLCARSPNASRADIRNVLVIKLDHIGDCILALPAVRRLARHFPQARLTVLAARTTAPIWSMVSEIAEIIEFDFFNPRSGLGLVEGSASEIDRLRAQLKSRRFDLAVDLRKHPETRHLLLESGARWLAGFDYQGRFPWLNIALEWEGDTRGAVKRRHVGDDLVGLVDTIAASAECRDVVPFAIGAARRPTRWRRLFERPVVCIHPGAGSPLRHWPVEHFAALIDRFVEMGTVNVALIGIADEQDLEQALLRRVRQQRSIYSMFGKLQLGELPNFLERCALFVGNNSGPQHLTATLGIPTVGIYSGVVDATEWAPVGPAAIAIRRDVSCAPCYLTRPEECHRAIACLTELAPEDVYAACCRLLTLSDRAKSDNEAATELS